MEASRVGAWKDDWRPLPKLPNELVFDSACRNAPVGWFFPSRGAPAIGKKLCAVCSSQVVCLEYAMTNKVHFGVWGGLTERERHTERIRRRKAME